MFEFLKRKKKTRPLSETHIDGQAAVTSTDSSEDIAFSGLVSSYTKLVDVRSELITKQNSLFSEQLGIGTDEDNLRQMSARQSNIGAQHARVLYRGLDMLQRVIDAPVEDSLRNGWKQTTSLQEPELDGIMAKRYRELIFNKKLELFMKWTRLYPRGAILYPVLTERVMDLDKAHLSLPLDMNEIDKIETLNIIPEDKFHFIVKRDDPLAKDFYTIEKIQVITGEVDSSRLLLHILDLDPEFGRGISLIDRTFTAIVGLNLAEWTISTLLIQYKMLLIKFPAKETQNKEQISKIKALLRKIQTEFTSKSVAAIPDNYDFEHLTTVFTGINEATSFQWEFLSAVSGIPQSILRGSALGELASAEKDVAQYHERIKAEEQEAKARPAIEFVGKLILHERQGEARAWLDAKNISPSSVEILVEFLPLESENSTTRAQRQMLDSQRGALDLNVGVRNTPEIRNELYPELDAFDREPNEQTPEQQEQMQKDMNDLMERTKKLLQPV